MDIDKVLIHPVMSEKSISKIETENKIVFYIDSKATKKDVKDAMNFFYKAKVDKVNILRDTKGNKKAIIKFKPEVKANELANKIGII